MKEEGGKRMTDMIVLSLKLKKYTRRRRWTNKDICATKRKTYLNRKNHFFFFCFLCENLLITSSINIILYQFRGARAKPVRRSSVIQFRKYVFKSFMALNDRSAVRVVTGTVQLINNLLTPIKIMFACIYL
jgi:hypothetical protein